MIQVALIVVSILLIVIGAKGFTSSGVQLSRNTILRGRTGRIVGAACIVTGLGLIPLFLLLFVKYSAWLGG